MMPSRLTVTGRNDHHETPTEAAARAASYVDAGRHAGLDQVRVHRLAGRPGQAYYALMRTFMNQRKILGLGYVAIPGKPYEAGGPLS